MKIDDEPPPLAARVIQTALNRHMILIEPCSLKFGKNIAPVRGMHQFYPLERSRRRDASPVIDSPRIVDAHHLANPIEIACRCLKGIDQAVGLKSIVAS